MRHLIVNIYLFLGAYQDKRNKSIKTGYLWTGGFLGIIWKLMDIGSKDFYVHQWILSILPGILFLICAKVGHEKIGDGDGWMLLILGCCMPKLQIWPLFCVSVLLLAVYSIFLLVIRKANRKTEIPYIPFLWISDVILWGLEYVL